MTSTPQTMQAITQPDPDSTILTLSTTPVPVPDFTKTEHLIRVHAASPCNGELLWPFYLPRPITRTLIPCPDFAGTVVSAPKDSPFQPGSEVYSRANYWRNGAGSEYTLCGTEEMALRPNNCTWVESTAIPLSGLTAWQALFVQSKIGDFESDSWKGKRIFVTAAAGGVGAWVVQLARLVGAVVVGTCGPDNVDFVKGLGADEVIDYRNTDIKSWAEGKEKFDLVIDCIGNKALKDTWWVVKDGGILMSIYQPPEKQIPEGCKVKDVTHFFFIMDPVRTHLEAITKLVEEGSCRGFVDSVWKGEEYQQAFEVVASGHAKGKVIIEFRVGN